MGIEPVIYTAGVEPGSNDVVFGLGGIGLNVAQGARMVGVDLNRGSGRRRPVPRGATPPELFEWACAEADQLLDFRWREGYDHGYYFISRQRR